MGDRHRVGDGHGRVADIAAHRASEMVWLLEHPPLYTAGTSAKPEDLIVKNLYVDSAPSAAMPGLPTMRKSSWQ